MNNLDNLLGKKLQTPEGTAKCCRYGASYLRDVARDESLVISSDMLFRLSEIFKAADEYLSEAHPDLEPEPKAVLSDPKATESMNPFGERPPWEKQDG